MASHRYGTRSKALFTPIQQLNIELPKLPTGPRPNLSNIQTTAKKTVAVSVIFDSAPNENGLCAIYLEGKLQGFIGPSLLALCSQVPKGTHSLRFTIRGGGLGSAIIFAFIQSRVVLLPEEAEDREAVEQALLTIRQLLGY